MIFWHREPWIMHSNLLLCRSHTPLNTSPFPLSFFTLAPSAPPPFSPPPSSLLPLSIFTIHPHQSSASFLLPLPIPPYADPPHLSSALLTLHLPPSFHQTADRKCCRIRPALPLPNAYCISVYYPGYCSGGCCSLMHLHIHGFRIGTLARIYFFYFGRN